MKLRLLLTALLYPCLLSPVMAQPAAHPDPATLEFVENKGQWDAHARYAAALPSGRLFAETDGLTFALLDAPALAHHGHAPTASSEPAANNTSQETPLRGHAVTLRFVGAAAATVLTATEATAERRNYLLGNDPAQWAQDVRGFRELHYAGLWPGVNARVYESADQHLEYDFEVAAGANAAAIALRHEGATAVALDAAGSLHVKTSVGTFTERAPLAWQIDAAGQRQPVPCRYQLAPDGTVRFALGRYDAARPLTIDPVVVFSTYSGSTVDNWGFTATYDAQGSLYSGGIAFGLGYPTTSGAFQTTFGGIIDIAIIKYNTAITGPGARVWATYLGGASSDFPTSLVVNSRGELLVLGVTSSANYPTTGGAVQTFFRGGPLAEPYGSGGGISLPNGSDLVVSRLNAAGTGLVGSTFLGGTANDGLLPFDRFPTSPQLVHNYGDPFRGDILVDAADNVYVASNTTSTNFPVGVGFRSTYQGGATDGVVLKLTPGLTAVTWGGYLGGAGADAAYSLQLAPGSGDVYVTGGTTSASFPGTAGGYRATPPGDVDGFVARIAANGLSLTRATYVGTSGYDQAYFLQLGSDGGVYVMGQTLGAFPRTPGLFSAGNGTLFIQKLAADLGSSLLSTTFGSTDVRNANQVALNPTAFLVDRCDRVYVCGWGGSSNRGTGVSYLGGNGFTFGLPVSANAIQPATDGSDFYLAQLSAGLTQLEYGTYYGRTNGTGDHVDGGTARFDPRGIVYQAVCSCSGSGFPIPGGVNTFSTTNNSNNCNNAAFVFNFQPNIASAGTDQAVCATAGPVLLVGSPAGGVWTGPGVTGSLATGFFFTPSAALLGVQTLTYTVASTGLCSSVDTRRMSVGSPPAVTFGPVGTGVFCRSATAPALAVVPLVGSPAGGTFSGPGVANGAFDPGAVGNGLHTLTYTYTNGCTVALTQPVQVAVVSAGTPQQVCAPGPAVALAGSPAGGTWSGPGVSGSPASGFVFTPTVALAGANTLTYSVTTTNPATAAQCTAASTVVFTVVPTPVISLTPLPAQCVANFAAVPLGSLATPAGGTWSGQGIGFGNVIGYYFLPSTGVGTYPLTYTVRNASCTASSGISVVVSNQPVVSAPADTLLCPGSTQPFRLRASLPGGTWTGPGVSGSVAAGFVFTPTAALAGTTSLTYSVANGACTGTTTRRVTVVPVPAVAAVWSPVACAETRLAPLTLRFALTTAGGSVPTSRVWDFGDGTQSTEAAPTHTYAAAGTYQPRLRVRYNLDRCETQVNAPVVEVLARRIPNIITPNGDTQNQYFRLGPDCPPRLEIFSRWGNKVFEAAAYRDDWSAQGQPAGVYYYLITHPDGQHQKGWVEVVR